MQTKNCSAEGIPAELIAKGLKKHTLHMDNKEILKSYAGYKISVFFLLSWKFLIDIGNQSNTANEMQLKKLIQNYKDCQSWKWHLLALNRYKVPLQIYHLNKIICSSMSSFNLFGGTGRWSVRSHRIVSL